MNTVEAINTLGTYLGPRDLEDLTPESLQKKFGNKKVDVLVLFGGSVLEGADLFAKAIQNNIALHTVIVGGFGHTTETLFEKMKALIPELKNVSSEAEAFNEYIKLKYGVKADLLETRSTNCGNNITNLLNLLEENKIKYSSILMIQDSTMQRRMDATLKKYRPDVNILNYSAYDGKVIWQNGSIDYVNDIHGIWNIERYLSLLMGEIPRLTDDVNGYGPEGKNFIAHVDIPQNVREAFDYLNNMNETLVRIANDAYAS